MEMSSDDTLLGFNVRVDVSPRIALYLARYNTIEAESHRLKIMLRHEEIK